MSWLGLGSGHCRASIFARDQLMPDLLTLAAYVVVVLGLFIVPGPAVLLVLGRAISGGRRVGVATGVGIATGDLVHTLMAAVGLSAILMTSALAFEIVKYVGVAYLCYLGIRAIRETPQAADIPDVGRTTAARAYREAVLTEILNPKTALFFLSFLPQFVDPAKGTVWLQLAVLGGIFVVMSAAFTTLLAFGAGSIARWLQNRPAVARLQGKIVGGIYLALGLRLALQEK
jgi:threonine/homoserine/homoserine lactone efflux protein